jgi:acyl carrier protein
LIAQLGEGVERIIGGLAALYSIIESAAAAPRFSKTETAASSNRHGVDGRSTRLAPAMDRDRQSLHARFRRQESYAIATYNRLKQRRPRSNRRPDVRWRYSAMDEPQIYERLTEIFKDVFDEDSIHVTPELTANDVAGWDSLTHVRLIVTVQKAFKIKFTTSEVTKMAKVDDLVRLIKVRA